MKRNTPIQELIDILKKECEDKSYSSEHRWGVRSSIIHAQKLLEKEKREICEAFVAGDNRGTGDIPFNCEQYFSQTFNPTEQ